MPQVCRRALEPASETCEMSVERVDDVRPRGPILLALGKLSLEDRHPSVQCFNHIETGGTIGFADLQLPRELLDDAKSSCAIILVLRKLALEDREASLQFLDSRGCVARLIR